MIDVAGKEGGTRMVVYHCWVLERHTAPCSYQEEEYADLDCSEDDSLSRFTAGAKIKANYAESCYNINEIFS